MKDYTELLEWLDSVKLPDPERQCSEAAAAIRELQERVKELELDAELAEDGF